VTYDPLLAQVALVLNELVLKLDWVEERYLGDECADCGISAGKCKPGCLMERARQLLDQVAALRGR
jgi:hypothetical protein